MDREQVETCRRLKRSNPRWAHAAAAFGTIQRNRLFPSLPASPVDTSYEKVDSVKRKRMLALATSILAAAPRAARAQVAAAPIRFATAPIEEAMLPYYAQEKGFFRAAGLNVELDVFPNGGSVTQGVLAGAVDVGVTNSGSLALAHTRGIPLYLLACGATYTQSSPTAHLVVAKSFVFKNARDLSGRTIAVTTIQDLMQASVLSWIDKNGGDSKSVKFVEMPFVQMSPAVVAKRIDGAVIAEPIFTGVKGEVQDIGLPFSAVNEGKPFQTLGIVCSKDFGEKNQPIAMKLASAIHAAARWANNSDNHAEAGRILAEQSKIQPEVIAAYPRLTFAETNSPAIVQPVIDLMTRYGILPRPFAASELFVLAIP
jgi:NitT/TauT family transport system substrate-binding protein